MDVLDRSGEGVGDRKVIRCRGRDDTGIPQPCREFIDTRHFLVPVSVAGGFELRWGRLGLDQVATLLVLSPKYR